MTGSPASGDVGEGPRVVDDLPVDSDVDVRDERAHPERDVFRGDGPRRRQRTWDVLAVIALGGGLGSVARYLVGAAIPTRPGHFPLGTFLINVTGCFVLGFLMTFILDVWPPRRYVRPFLAIGFLGGYTTFSTFTAEIRALAVRQAWAVADSYAVDSLLAGLAAVWCGIALARLLAGLPVRRPRDEGNPR